MNRHTMFSDPIFEPEFNFLSAICECGSRFHDVEGLDLHKKESCLRRFEPNFKYPSAVPRWFDLDVLGVADGGRKA